MGYQELTQKGFIDELKEASYGPYSRKFCFILGAGASKSSGIKTGQELVDIWEKELEIRNNDDYLKWKEKLGITDENKYSFYSQFYEKRFDKCPKDGLNFLEKEMENVTPGVGYVVLAYLLTETLHNVVITTNFDHLSEDAVNYYVHKIPKVIGHEDLAKYISKPITRPTIIKIHRDLLYDPKNTSQEVNELNQLWKDNLGNVFEEYHPVFIGYAGNDNSLMDYLLENKEKFKNKDWKFPYWTLYKSNTPKGKVKDFLDMSEGYCINCTGFDELMCLIGKELGYKLPKEEEFLSDARDRYNKLSKDFLNIIGNKMPNLVVDDKSNDNALEEAVQIITDNADSFTTASKINLLRAQGKYEEALKLQEELIKEEPDNIGYYNDLGDILREMERYEEAYKAYQETVRLDPDNAYYHNNLGIALHMMKKYEEACKEYEIAIRLKPEVACYHDNLGISLHMMEKYEEACEQYEEAIRLEPKTARYHDNLGISLHMMKQYEEACKQYEEAIRLKPKTARYHDNLGISLEAMNKNEEACKAYTEAVRLEPENKLYQERLTKILLKLQ